MTDLSFKTGNSDLAGFEPKDVARRLIANGYRPVPCAGKAVKISGWTETDFTEQDFAGRHNVGIKTGCGIALIDIDVTDPDAVNAITAEWQRRHPGTLQRTGKAPKTAFLVTSDLARKIDVKLPALGKDEKGNPQKVEVLAEGQQFIAYGIHPDTGDPYKWHGLDPLDTFLGTKDALPVVTEVEIRAFVQWVQDAYGEKEPDRPLSERAAPALIDTGNAGSAFWRNVNDAALADLDAWVPVLLPAAKKQATGGWRVSSKDLGRDFEEDLSLHPGGIQDFGPETTMTSIDVVEAFGDTRSPKAAAFWLCDKVGKSPASLGWSEKSGRAANADQQPRTGQTIEIDLSHDALATDLGSQEFDQNGRYVAIWSKWLFWSGSRWEADDKLGHLTRTRAFLRDRASDLVEASEHKAAKLDQDKGEGEGDKLRRWAKEQARALRSKVTVAAVESLARSNPASVAGAEDFDGDRMLLGTPGGTVDLRTGQLRDALRTDNITKLTACAPAPQGEQPERWLRFLNDVFSGDQEVISFMQRAAGYALTGQTTEHKLLFLYGTGRNGKSVFLNTLFDLWGDYARRAAAETFLNSAVEKHSTGLAGLQGARLVAGSELPVGKTWDESVIKDLTGGDRMTARFMRGDFFDFNPQLTLMIAGNNQPSFRGVDEAIRARVVLVPFTVTIPAEKRDPDLADKLRAEGLKILRWAIDGAVEWQKRGLDVPASVAAASTEYMDDEDTLGQFLSDETVSTPDGFVTTSELHQRFGFWCERQGLHHWTQNTMRKELKSRGFQEHRRAQGRGFMGVKLA